MAQYFLTHKWMLIIPALLLMIVLYPIGSNSYLTLSDPDGPAPAMQIDDLSNGFSRLNHPVRQFAIFHSMVMSIAYVPYIWVRTKALPPYSLAALDVKFPSLGRELVILMRMMNLLAAIGILVTSFYIMRMFCTTDLGVLLASISLAFNPDLMFQTNVVYYESWSVFWVMLSALCFVRILSAAERLSLRWLSFFFIVAALAVSTHERMAGFYLLSIPYMLCWLFWKNYSEKKPFLPFILLISSALAFGVLAFFLANHVFQDGFEPIIKYIKYKSIGINSSSERLGGLRPFLNIQRGCHTHAMRLIFWNLGFVMPFFSLIGIWGIWQRRLAPALALFLFPMGYEIISVGLPGWTSGRYMMGQMIFATIFAGYGIAWLMDHIQKPSSMRWLKLIVIMGLGVELLFFIAVKVGDIFYHPYRTVEAIVQDPSNRDKKVAIQWGNRPLAYTVDFCNQNNCEFIPVNVKGTTDADMVVSTSNAGVHCRKIRSIESRVPPKWLELMVKDSHYLYLYSYGVSPVYIERCDR